MGESGRKMAYPEFLQWESQQPVRHEFVAGECFAMTGGTDRHVELFRREADGRWVLHPAAAGERLELASLGLELAIGDLYEDL